MYDSGIDVNYAIYILHTHMYEHMRRFKKRGLEEEEEEEKNDAT